MKKIMEKYNYAFGYVKSYLVLAGVCGLGFVIFSLWQLLSGNAPASEALILLVSGIVVLGIGTIVLLQTRAKCPLQKRKTVSLILVMCFVAIVGCFTLAFRVFGKLLGMGGGAGGNQKFANRYICESTGESCTLYSVTNDKIATLHDSQGNSISVYQPNENSDLLYDDAGVSYRPC